MNIDGIHSGTSIGANVTKHLHPRFAASSSGPSTHEKSNLPGIGSQADQRFCISAWRESPDFTISSKRCAYASRQSGALLTIGANNTIGLSPSRMSRHVGTPSGNLNGSATTGISTFGSAFAEAGGALVLRTTS